MKPDENDKLWELLGQARPPAVSPFFARNILRAVRQEEAARPPRSFPLSFLAGMGRLLHSRAWQSSLAATCAIAIAALVNLSPDLLLRHPLSQPVEPAAIASQIVGNPDYEVINHLDELVADEESSLWLDDSTHDSSVQDAH